MLNLDKTGSSSRPKVIPISRARAIDDDASDTPVMTRCKGLYDKLDSLSTYKSSFDWAPLRELEIRSKKQGFRGGVLFKSPLKLVNYHATCRQCLYAFEFDTYGRGCIHECTYCYAKAQLTVHGFWNNPFPAPIDLSAVRKLFYSVFETDRPSKWRDLLEKRIPLRIGSMSDSFMWMDEKYKVTQEFLRILKHYKYPHVNF